MLSVCCCDIVCHYSFRWYHYFFQFCHIIKIFTLYWAGRQALCKLAARQTGKYRSIDRFTWLQCCIFAITWQPQTAWSSSSHIEHIRINDTTSTILDYHWLHATMMDSSLAMRSSSEKVNFLVLVSALPISVSVHLLCVYFRQTWRQI